MTTITEGRDGKTVWGWKDEVWKLQWYQNPKKQAQHYFLYDLALESLILTMPCTKKYLSPILAHKIRSWDQDPALNHTPSRPGLDIWSVEINGGRSDNRNLITDGPLDLEGMLCPTTFLNMISKLTFWIEIQTYLREPKREKVTFVVWIRRLQVR